MNVLHTKGNAPMFWRLIQIIILVVVLSLVFSVPVWAQDDPGGINSDLQIDGAADPPVVVLQQPAEVDSSTLVNYFLAFLAGIFTMAATSLPSGINGFLRGVRDSPKTTDPLERILMILVAAPLLTKANDVAKAIEAGAGIVGNVTDGKLNE